MISTNKLEQSFQLTSLTTRKKKMPIDKKKVPLLIESSCLILFAHLRVHYKFQLQLWTKTFLATKLVKIYIY